MTSPESDYAELVRFLVTPFLEEPDKLSIHCETYANGKIWVRLAFADADKGHVFGRNGRTIQSMRTLVTAAGKLADQPVHLEVFGSQPARESRGGRRGGSRRRGGDGPKKPVPKPVKHSKPSPEN